MSGTSEVFDDDDLREIERMIPNELLDHVLTQNPLHQVYFRAGLLACREYMAKFVEQGGDTATAASIRANWWPQLGPDPGKPRAYRFEEVAEEYEQENGKPGWKSLPMDPSTEALSRAWDFLGRPE